MYELKTFYFSFSNNPYTGKLWHRGRYTFNGQYTSYTRFCLPRNRIIIYSKINYSFIVTNRKNRIGITSSYFAYGIEKNKSLHW